jgi:mannose/fructose/N-acetylgalactosamine-specific phosphotransferase system component IID
VIQKEYRKKVDALENKLKWFNIAMMPFIIMLFGLLVAMSRKVRNSAK